MKTKVILGIVTILILAIALTSGASNMGFKLSQTTTGGQAKYIGLPYYNSYSTQTAAYLRNDLLAAGGGVVSVSNWTGTAWQNYTGAGVNFALVPGVGYRVTTSVGLTNWVVVGSHNPSTTVVTTAGQAKYVAIPYHSTSTTAAQFRNELIAAGGGVVSVSNWTGTAWQNYTGAGVNFAIVPGAAYRATTSVGVTWTPAHY